MEKPSAIRDAKYVDALDYLYGRINYERIGKTTSRPFRLARMKSLLAELGNPETGLSIVHVAGTKGKGSTCQMLAGIAKAAGWRCGLYSSPHLQFLEERFQINGEMISPSMLTQLIGKVRQAAETLEAQQEGAATFFELTTAIALEYFRQSRCDLVILEVGLGGRLDSTNVCSPLLTAITSIGLDHQKILGETIDLIAAEKAGIIKPQIPVVSSCNDPVAAEVIRRVATDTDAPCYEAGRDFQVRYISTSDPCKSTFCYESNRPEFRLSNSQQPWELGIPGAHQCQNAATALALTDLLNAMLSPERRITESDCRRALAGIKLPAKIEFIPGNPDVILDTAHNQDSMQALCDVLKERFDSRNILAIFGTSSDKNASQMLKTLAGAADQILLTRYRTNPRWFPPQQLAELATRHIGHCWEVIEDAQDALHLARRKAGENGLIVISGSFFLAAELAPLVLPQNHRTP